LLDGWETDPQLQGRVTQLQQLAGFLPLPHCLLVSGHLDKILSATVGLRQKSTPRWFSIAESVGHPSLVVSQSA
jgi:hypothetical protein